MAPTNDPRLPDCEGTIGGSKTKDACGVCGGDNSKCADCDGKPFGSATVDHCSKCDADLTNDCVQDCVGTWGGVGEYDNCKVCGGGGSTCATTTVQNSMSFEGDASEYAKGSAKYTKLVSDLADSFGVIVAALSDFIIGNRRRMLEHSMSFEAARRQLRANMQINYVIKLDKVVNVSHAFGDGLTAKLTSKLGVTPTVSAPVVIIFDCFGVASGNSTLDSCDVCSGNNTCVDCAGKWRGGAKRDRCGVCDADSTNDCRADCQRIWGGSAALDSCDVCNGDDVCVDCKGVFRGGVKLDNCGVCGGDGSTCTVSPSASPTVLPSIVPTTVVPTTVPTTMPTKQRTMPGMVVSFSAKAAQEAEDAEIGTYTGLRTEPQDH